MKRKDKIKLTFSRNWKLPGQERISNWLKPSNDLKNTFKDGITWLSEENLAIYTTADNYIEWTILSCGTYEAEIEKLIAISLLEGDSALDIGANIGLQSLRMARYAGKNGKILAFEPLAHLRDKFLKNVQLNRFNNVSLFPFALSDKESNLEYAINENIWNQGTFSLSHTPKGNNTQTINVKIGDNLVEITNLKKLTLIKIDVEGHEFNVLKGLTKTLERFKPRLIFEYDKNYWAANNYNIADCFNFLTNLNYNIYQINPVGCERVYYANLIQAGNLFCIVS